MEHDNVKFIPVTHLIVCSSYSFPGLPITYFITNYKCVLAWNSIALLKIYVFNIWLWSKYSFCFSCFFIGWQKAQSPFLWLTACSSLVSLDDSKCFILVSLVNSKCFSLVSLVQSKCSKVSSSTSKAQSSLHWFKVKIWVYVIACGHLRLRDNDDDS